MMRMPAGSAAYRVTRDCSAPPRIWPGLLSGCSTLAEDMRRPSPPFAALRRLSPPLVQMFTQRQNIPPGSSRALGWDTPSENSSAGTQMGPNAFGHTGFTGTSIWFDPDRDLFIILLTNRVNPTRANTRIFQVRRRVADLVNDALTPPQ